MKVPSLKGRDFLSCADLTREEVWHLFHLAKGWKRDPQVEQERNVLKGQALALYFEKPSLRTRVTFELAVVQLGGHPVILTQAEVGMNEREAVKDVSRNLSRWVKGIVARVRQHQTLLELADFASVPVVNALSDREHPCQALADLFTLWEKWGELEGKTVAFVGDGYNVAHSLLLLCSLLGVHIRLATPAGYQPRTDIVERAKCFASRSGSSVKVLNDPVAAVAGADAVYTDVWVSMGQEQERQERLKVFPPFQVNRQLLAHAKDDAFVLHCLPAHRGEEITDEILDGDQCIALDQAENRLHVQRAIVACLVGGL